MYRAVKVVRREDFEYERTFEREFEGIQRYEKVSQDHPGLVDVLHVGRDRQAGFYYYVMELADDEGGTYDEIDEASYRPRTLISDLRRRRVQSVRSCVDLGVAIGGALGHLHAAGLTHRDVKPANIIFVKGQPKLADVGLVANTGQRTYVGTEGYVPPEGPGTHAADLYSLAMVLYEMHTGKDRLDFPELPTNLEIPPSVNRDEWRALNSVICRGGSPDPRKRYGSAEDFVDALETVCTVPWKAARPRRGVATILFVLFAMLGLLAIAGGAGYLLWQDHHSFLEKNGPLLSDSQEAGGVNGSRLRTPVGPIAPIRENSTKGKADGNQPTATDEGTQPKEASVRSDEPMEVAEKIVIAESSDDGKNEKGKAPPKSEEGKAKDEKTDSKQAQEGMAPSETQPAPKGDTKKGSSTEPGESASPSMLVATEVTGAEPDKPPAMLKAEVVQGHLQITSQPAQARVYYEGKDIGATDGAPFEFPVGPVELVIKQSGYRDFQYTGEVGEGTSSLQAVLRPNLGPILGQPWTNSIGMVFQPQSSGYLSTTEVTVEVFEQFLAEVNEPIPVTGLQGIAHIPKERGRWLFCDWLSAREQRAGYLSTKQYYRPVRNSEDARKGSFFLAIENAFGTLVLNSEPSGAQVYRGTELLGETPIVLNDLRLGYYELTLQKSGYKSTIAKGELSDTEAQDLVITLEEDTTAMLTEIWRNSQGMLLVPIPTLGGILAASRETPYEAYVEFLAARGVAVSPTEMAAARGYPASSVAYGQAIAFCEWLTQREQANGLLHPSQRYRLPTDTEWSALAGLTNEKGSTPEEKGQQGKTEFLWGNFFPPPRGAGNFADATALSLFDEAGIIGGYTDSFPTAAPVASFTPSAYGLYDLAGNVWEWVSDPYNQEADGIGTMRGGAWDTAQAKQLSIAYRKSEPLSSTEASNGFRYVLEVNKQ